MDWFSSPRSPAEPSAASKQQQQPAEISDPKSPVSPSRGTSQSEVNNREIHELQTILTDSNRLAELAASGLKAGTLEATDTLEAISELSARLLCRNRCRAAFTSLSTFLLGDTAGKQNAAADQGAAASKVLVPSYFRHTQSSGGEEDGGQTDLWVSKVFLHGLPNAPQPGMALCARFSLSARADLSFTTGAEDALYDCSLKIMQVVGPADHKFTFSFALADLPASQATDWVLDEGQRSRLHELQGRLGLASGRWTSIGLLGATLAACGCEQLGGNPFFDGLVRACKEAHRQELLAQSGSLF